MEMEMEMEMEMGGRDFVAALRHPWTLAAGHVTIRASSEGLATRFRACLFPPRSPRGPLQATETQEPKAPVFASPAPLQASLRGAGNAKTQR